LSSASLFAEISLGPEINLVTRARRCHGKCIF
jgi:hypothetical protein